MTTTPRALRRSTVAWMCAACVLLACDEGDDRSDGSVAVDDGGRDASVPILPDLQSMTHAQARALAAYARTLRSVSRTDPESRPAAWAMVNVSCEDRTMALQYAIALAQRSRPPTPPVLDDRALDAETVEALAKLGQHVAASINIVGPLFTEQTLRLPDGSELDDHPQRYYWSYHHAVALDVEGTMHVLDLSISDDPVPVEDWTRGFVDASVECVHMSDAEQERVGQYFRPAFANLIPGERPARACGYTFTPIFTVAPGRGPQIESVIGSAQEMQVLSGGLQTILAEAGVTLNDEQLPSVVSRYRGLSEQMLCDHVHLNYCDLL